jgi:hypothetical protein
VLAPGGAAPSSAAEVVISDELGPRRLRCDRQGLFSVAGLGPGTKLLQAAAKGYAPSGVTEVALEPGRPHQAVLQLGAGKGIGGRVLGADGLPVARARVSVRPGGPSGGLRQLLDPRTLETDADGAYLFDDLAELPYVVAARGPSGAVASRAGVPPGSYNVVLRLQDTGGIAGIASDGLSGKPIRDYTVEVTEAVGGDPYLARPKQRVVSTSGQFRLEGLVPGTYALAITARGYGPATKQGVAVVAGHDAQVSVVLDSGGTVSGVVVDERGAGVPGAALRMDTGWHGATVYSDARGAFAIPDVARGRRSLSASHPDYDTRIVSGIGVFAQSAAQVRVELARRKAAGAGFSLSGIGAVLSQDKGRLVVVRAMPGSPAEIAGVKPGDVVTAIDGAAVSAMSFGDCVEALRGISGTPVRLRLQRGAQVFDVDVIRADVNVPAAKS